MHLYQKVLVGIDTSAQSKLALQKAVAIASENQATLDIVTVINTEKFVGITQGPMGFGAATPQILDELTTKLKANLATARQTAVAAGVPDVQVHLQTGNSKTLLATTMPQQLGTDLIVVGATGLNAVSRFLIGSNAAYVIRHAPCDVLVVRTDLHNQLIDLPKRMTPTV
ncbi:universal stress protein [Lactiplantibacillus fabifermentans]|uniref:Universal stress protein n=2 Tax=Lactiplantibacillus fabifermentans TaxID=483011 RepID=A0A0R2NR27_9LACO|nr:universal stress protein [Lactiplantibacillus fabifermentans]ETY74641.1 universal stress protein UspA [Lactiplantibacillus fabifermentans T30PCM01]KRO28166.1 universal stress protein [Lactiplantibacillus fabifermentans DSM 21115]